MDWRDTSDFEHLDWMRELRGMQDPDSPLRQKSKFERRPAGWRAAPASLSDILKMIEESLAREEIVDAYSSDLSPMVYWYSDYLHHKYGTQSIAVIKAMTSFQKTLFGEYTGVDDPRLIKFLLSQPGTIDDRGNTDDSNGGDYGSGIFRKSSLV